LRLRERSLSQRRNLPPIRKNCQNRSARQSRRRTKKKSAPVKTGKGVKGKGKRQKVIGAKYQMRKIELEQPRRNQSFENCMKNDTRLVIEKTLFYAILINRDPLSDSDLNTESSPYKRIRTILMISERIDRNFFAIHHLQDEDPDAQYWRKQSPQDRILAIELMRRINYGHSIATARLARFFEIAEFPPR
jgi:hypothetical protein